MNLKERMLVSRVLGKQLVPLLEELIVAVNDLRAKYTAHLANATAHNSADATNTVAGSNVEKLENR